jgi:hypothetical protein
MSDSSHFALEHVSIVGVSVSRANTRSCYFLAKNPARPLTLLIDPSVKGLDLDRAQVLRDQRIYFMLGL